MDRHGRDLADRGLVPVTVPLLGRNTHGALPLRRMLAPMALDLAGIVLVNAHALTTGPKAARAPLLGVLMAVLAMPLEPLRAGQHPLSGAKPLQRHGGPRSGVWSSG
jgi:ABC-type antimicrobial peptide transport system ATPase subunit